MTLEELKKKYEHLVDLFDVHPDYKKLTTIPTDCGAPHIELNDNTYSYVITERGEEIKRLNTNDPVCRVCREAHRNAMFDATLLFEPFCH